MNDIVIDGVVAVAASGTGAVLWFCYSTSRGQWKPPIPEPLWFGWIRKPFRTKAIRSMVKTGPVA
jgi:hypothetical protein